MHKQKTYASYADFEKDEYMRVKSFYENLEDIMDEEMFQHLDDSRSRKRHDSDTVEELEF